MKIIKDVECASSMDWQARYAEENTPWDKGCAAPALVDVLNGEEFDRFHLKRVLVPGCGLGHDAAELAKHARSVVAVDIAPLAVERAAGLYRSFDNLEFLRADIFDLPECCIGGFEVIWEHTCFCALAPELRRDYVEALWNALIPGGFLVGVFFLNPDVEPGEGPPFGASVEEICAVCEGYFELEEEWVPARFFEGREEREKMLLFRRVS